jgi:hypothetical protein
LSSARLRLGLDSRAARAKPESTKQLGVLLAFQG